MTSSKAEDQPQRMRFSTGSREGVFMETKRGETWSLEGLQRWASGRLEKEWPILKQAKIRLSIVVLLAVFSTWKATRFFDDERIEGLRTSNQILRDKGSDQITIKEVPKIKNAINEKKNLGIIPLTQVQDSIHSLLRLSVCVSSRGVLEVVNAFDPSGS